MKDLAQELTRVGDVVIYRVLQKPDGWGVAVALFIVVAGDEWLIIDTGWDGPRGTHVWENAVKELVLSWKGLRRILVTHGHPDHIGLARALTELAGRPVALHPDVLTDVASYKEAATGILRTQFLVEAGYLHARNRDAAPNPYQVSSIVSAPTHIERLGGGDQVELGAAVMEVLFTPGHGRGHLCFMDSERRIAFTGDMVLPAIFPTISGTPWDEANPLKLYFESIAALDRSGVEVVLPSHGDPIEEPRRRIWETRQYFEHQLAHARQSLTLWDATTHQLAARQTFQGRRYSNLSPMGQVVALGEMRAYPELLEGEGEIRSSTEPSGARVYSLA